MGDIFRHIWERIRNAAQSKRGKDVMLYLLFVAVAFVFWVFMSLDTQMERDFDVPLELQDVPDSVTLIHQIPPAVNVSVKGKDSQLLRFMWGKSSPIKLKWADYAADNHVTITPAKLMTRLKDYFGSAIQVISCRPDSVKVAYTTQPGVKVKLMIQADIHPQLQYIMSGAPKANVDSVTLYSVDDIPHSLKFVNTEPIVKSGLKDTARYEVKIKPIAGVRIVPDKVTVTIPVEPLIARKRMIGLEVTNLPPDKSLVTFPSRIEISYLVPMSAYNDDYPVKAYVNFNDVNMPGNKLPVNLSLIPDIYHNLSFTPTSVEYIIENDD